ncbi:MAG: tetratricopeptide repeat protein [Methylococcales bacterium]
MSNISNSYALDWNDVYNTKAGSEKHKIIEQLAKHNDGKAQFILSHHYRLGDFVEKSREKANFWLFKSANNQYAEAEYMLGSSYNTPRFDFQLDYKKAVKWLILAAKHGHIEAQYELGEHYHTGSGVTKDLVLSYVWLELASRDDSFLAIRSRNMVEDEMTEAQVQKAKANIPKYFKLYVKPY